MAWLFSRKPLEVARQEARATGRIKPWPELTPEGARVKTFVQTHSADYPGLTKAFARAERLRVKEAAFVATAPHAPIAVKVGVPVAVWGAVGHAVRPEARSVAWQLSSLGALAIARAADSASTSFALHRERLERKKFLTDDNVRFLPLDVQRELRLHPIQLEGTLAQRAAVLRAYRDPRFLAKGVALETAVLAPLPPHLRFYAAGLSLVVAGSNLNVARKTHSHYGQLRQELARLRAHIESQGGMDRL